MRLALYLCTLLSIGCCIIKNNRPEAGITNIGITPIDTVVVCHMNDTLALRISIYNPNDTAVTIPIGGVAFSLWEYIEEDYCPGESYFIFPYDRAVYRGVSTDSANDPVFLEAKETKEICINFDFSIISIMDAEYKLHYSVQMIPKGNTRIIIWGISNNIVRIRWVQ